MITELPEGYVKVKTVWEFVDVNPYEYLEGYIPLYGMEYLLWDKELECFHQHKLDKNTQDSHLQKYIEDGKCFRKQGKNSDGAG